LYYSKFSSELVPQEISEESGLPLYKAVDT